MFITSTCQRLDELQSRLQKDSNDPQFPHYSDLHALIRTIIREELQGQDLRRSPAACVLTPTVDLSEVVKQRVDSDDYTHNASYSGSAPNTHVRRCCFATNPYRRLWAY